MAGLLIALSVGNGSGDRTAAKPTATHAAKRRASRSAAPIQSKPSPAPATSPASTVNDFYQRAARHDYAGAWSLLTPRAQAELGGIDSFARGQSTLRSIAFPLLRTIDQSAASATVELRSNAVHSNRVDHVCGTVGLVRSGSRWVLDVLQLNACPGAAGSAPAGASAPARGRSRGPKGRRGPKGHGEHGGGGNGGD